MVVGVSPMASTVEMYTLFQPFSCSRRLVHTSSDFEAVYMPPICSIAVRRKITLVPTQNAALNRFFPGWMNR